ncbi:MAG: cytochrome c3 family protein [Planctomycetota bacterium]
MTVNAAKPLGWIICTVKRYWFAFLAGFAFAIVCFLVVNAIAKPFSTSQYCGSKCHEMNASYRSWELSSHHANHAGVVAQCIDCHLPPKDKFFTHLIVKAYAGAKDIYKHHFAGNYDSEKIRKKVLDNMPNGRCLKCHSSLLAKPGSSASRIAHQATLNPTEDLKPRCVECHQQLHERERKVFSPD